MNVKERYDIKPYKSSSYYLTKMTRQRDILKLLGFNVYEKENVRVLEIGSSYGGNIIGDALYYPKVEFVGIDISMNQVKEGNRIIEEIGLDNIKLYQKDIFEYDGEFGKFDHIICHGVFSWVNDKVKSKILDVIKSSLTKKGSAVISYNVYPGWKNIDILKDIMKFRIKMLKNNGHNVSPHEEVAYGRGALDFISTFTQENNKLKEEAKEFAVRGDHYLYHEFLEENNDSFYLYDFQKMLNEKGLTHVTDSNLELSNRYIKNRKLDEDLNLECAGSNILKEQYYDFIFNTSFRYSIITHIDRKHSQEDFIKNIKDFHFSGLYYRENEDEEYEYNGKRLKKEYNFLIEEFNKVFPNTIKLQDLIQKYGETVIDYILVMIREGIVEFSLEELKIDREIKNIVISDKFKKYLEASLLNNDKIDSSSKRGTVYEEATVKTLLYFDGTKSLDEIRDLVISKGIAEDRADEFLERIILEIKINGQVK